MKLNLNFKELMALSSALNSLKNSTYVGFYAGGTWAAIINGANSPALHHRRVQFMEVPREWELGRALAVWNRKYSLAVSPWETLPSEVARWFPNGELNIGATPMISEPFVGLIERCANEVAHLMKGLDILFEDIKSCKWVQVIGPREFLGVDPETGKPSIAWLDLDKVFYEMIS